MSQVTPTSIPLLNGRYRIEEKLGIGRLAVVYRAYDTRLQRTVLVHLLRKELQTQEPLRQRFQSEARAGARRSHQSLLEIYDTGELSDRPYIVTEFVAGPSLRELGALTPEDALLYFRQLVGAIAACQAAGVPHPPISSNNVILAGDGHVELVESWLISPQEATLDLARYRAPERANGQPATPATAVYALGLLLVEMLTGRRAIDGDDPRAVAQAHLTTRIPALAELRPALYVPALEQLLQRVIARDPAQRPQNAASLGAELDELRRAMGAATGRLAPHSGQPRAVAQPRQVAPQISEPAPPPIMDDPLIETRLAANMAPIDRARNTGSLAAIGVMLALFLAVAIAAFYGAMYAADRLFDLQIALPTVNVPTLPDFGIALPEWLTGVPEGQGEVLTVNISGDSTLNLRQAPNLAAGVIARLANGARVRRLEGVVADDTQLWVEVRAKIDGRDIDGWAASRFLRTESGQPVQAGQ